MKKQTFVTLLMIGMSVFAYAQKYADCIKAKSICKKDTYTFEKLNGEGKNNFETVPTPCFMGGVGTEDGNAEKNSAWIKFEIKKAGSLKFTIKPLKESDDMDFVVYRMASGDCDDKKIVRCCASGDQKIPSFCMGTTGLRDGEDDYREDPGCKGDNNSFLAPIKAKAGDVFVVLVSNVTSDGPGFTIRFFGTCMLPCDEEKPKPTVKPDPKPEVALAEPTPSRVEPTPRVEETKPTPPIAETKPKVEEPKPTTAAPMEIEGRKTVVSRTLSVKNRNITLKVWDASIEDGDVISIYVNGQRLYSNIELKTRPQEFSFTLDPGENIITAHVESFGQREPNTAIVSVFDGKKTQKISLNATKKTEESLKITVD